MTELKHISVFSQGWEMGLVHLTCLEKYYRYYKVRPGNKTVIVISIYLFLIGFFYLTICYEAQLFHSVTLENIHFVIHFMCRKNVFNYSDIFASLITDWEKTYRITLCLQIP